MILLTIVKNDPEGLARTLASIKMAVNEGLDVERWLVKTSGPTDTSLAGVDELPSYTTALESTDNGIYDAMNQAVRAVVKEDSRAWVCLLNAGDQLHPGFAFWYKQRDRDQEADFGLLIGRAITTDGAIIAPITSIIGQGGLNFCHQAALFRREVLTRFPFSTKLPDGRS
jgi:hypothetical protein